MALAELADTPAGLLYEILELRSFAAAKAELDNAKNKADVEPTVWTDMVMEAVAERVRRRLRHGRD